MSAPHLPSVRNVKAARRTAPKPEKSRLASAFVILATALAMAIVGIGAFFGTTHLTNNSGSDIPAKTAMPRTDAPGIAQSAARIAAPIARIQRIQPAQAQPSAASVVRAYFDAINSGINDRDFVAAWALGGKNIAGPDYGSFVASFASTANDNVTVNSVVGNKVSIQLDATQTDGSHRFFSGTYTVQNGSIVAANIKRV